MMKKNNIQIYILLIFLFILFSSLENISLNENIPELDMEILKLIRKFFDPKSIPVLTENEKLIAEYWKIKLNSDPNSCPFTTLTSRGLTREEANLLIEFFKIEDAKDLEKLRQYL